MCGMQVGASCRIGSAYLNTRSSALSRFHTDIIARPPAPNSIMWDRQLLPCICIGVTELYFALCALSTVCLKREFWPINLLDYKRIQWKCRTIRGSNEMAWQPFEKLLFCFKLLIIIYFNIHNNPYILTQRPIELQECKVPSIKLIILPSPLLKTLPAGPGPDI